MKTNSYEIATIGEKEKNSIKKAEQIIKQETGKDLVIIAWEKKVQ